MLYRMDYSGNQHYCPGLYRQLGLQTYIAGENHVKGSRIKRNLFAPLSVIQLATTTRGEEDAGYSAMLPASTSSPRCRQHDQNSGEHLSASCRDQCRHKWLTAL
ncbi:MAG: hypothetical protein U0Z17_03685 [Bacteroidales bacterium]